MSSGDAHQAAQYLTMAAHLLAKPPAPAEQVDLRRVEALLEQVVERLATLSHGVPAATEPTLPLPVSIALWNSADIALYLRRSADTIRREVLVLPSFPKPIRLPAAGRGHPLYKAHEVVRWAESHQIK